MSAFQAAKWAPPSARSINVLVEAPGAPPRPVRKLASGPVHVWVSRAPSTLNDAALLAAFVEFARAPGADALQSLLSGVRGHFALLARGGNWIAGAVDRSRTIPVFISGSKEGFHIGFDAVSLAQAGGLGPSHIDPDGALALAMAGYTSGTRTLYRGMSQLRAGECAFVTEGQGLERRRYHRWQPWLARDVDKACAKRELADVTLSVVEQAARYASGRQIAIPLSAGYDSRLIASALKKLGVRDVVTFAYGIPGNFEAEASRRIAEHLGFPWRFVPLTVGRQSRFFQSGLHKRYIRYADSCASTPFEQDLAPVSLLKGTGCISSDAVLINGNSGDFIAGNHILPHLRTAPEGLDLKQRRVRIVNSIIGKHFTLWSSLQTPERIGRIVDALSAELDDVGAELGDPDGDHGLYEYLEFNDRQTKYVITGQRVYEFLGHDWCLPLWDDAYLDFWERMPLSLKAAQKLYREMLEGENWGGVWNDIRINARTVRPRWLIPLRFFGRGMAAPFGTQAWHSLDRRVFAYWYELVGNYGIASYSRVLMDRRGFRNAISWHTEAYLAGKGLAYDGTLR